VKHEVKMATSELTPDEIRLIRESCRCKKVNTYRVNPVAQSIEMLMGYLDPKTKEFTDGIFATIMRKIITHLEDKSHSWIIFDGQVRIEWVENLNSVLDDNRKLTLMSGESLPFNEKMHVVIESDDLSKCTPAIISRCGVIFIDQC
jgi:hypothetical protein